jgi:hypothetical protein
MLGRALPTEGVGGFYLIRLEPVMRIPTSLFAALPPIRARGHLRDADQRAK